MTLNRNAKAICFDLDGTLLDTLEDIADAMNRVLAAHSYPIHPIDAYRTFVGDGMPTLVRRALPQDLSEDHIAKCVEEMRQAYDQSWDNKTRPYDGVPHMLDALVEQSIKLVILSNKPDDFTQLCVKRLLKNWHFDHIQGVKLPYAPKPDTQAMEDIIKDFGFAKEEWLYVGDTNTDMKTAKGANLMAVGVSWGFRDKEELIQTGADHVIDHPRDLLGLI